MEVLKNYPMALVSLRATKFARQSKLD